MAVFKVCVLVSFTLVCVASCCHMDTYDYPNFPQQQTENYTPDPVWEAMQDSIKKGREIFESTCTSCHTIGSTMIGPSAREIMDKRSTTWLKGFLLHFELYKKDSAVKANMKESQMKTHDTKYLKPSDVDFIIAYFKNGFDQAVY